MVQISENTSLDKMPVFDIDTHWAEPADLWTSRAPEKYRGRVLEVRTKDNGKEAWFVGNHEVGMIGPSVVRNDMSKMLNAYGVSTFQEMSRASTHAADRLAYMDGNGVGSQILYPNIIGFGSQKLMEISDDVELRQWHVNAYNDALIDLQKDGQGRLLPQAALPLWDLDACLKELDRIRKLGLTGIVMSDKPQHFGQASLADPKWDRFFATCQDLGLPINFHIGSGSFEGELGNWWQSDRSPWGADMVLNGPLTTFGTMTLFMNMSQTIMNLILGGMLEKYPKLKFVIVESGASWIPFLIQGIEHNWKEMLTSGQRAKYKREPREMFVEQVYCSYWFEDRDAIDFYLKQFGPDNLLFETDFPHPTSLYPGVRDKVIETLGHQPVATQRKVLFENAERLYGVEVGAVGAAPRH